MTNLEEEKTALSIANVHVKNGNLKNVNSSVLTCCPIEIEKVKVNNHKLEKNKTLSYRAKHPQLLPNY